MTTPLQCSEVNPAEEEQLLDLYRRFLSQAERTIQLYYWRKQGRVTSGGIRPFAAWRGTVMVGAVSAVPVVMTWNGNYYRAVWQQDSIVDPAVRGMGIGGKLVEIARCDSDLLLAKGTSDAMYHLRLKSGFTDVPNSEYLTCVIARNYQTTGMRRWLYFRFLYLWFVLRRRRVRTTTVRCSQITEFSQDFDELDRALAQGSCLRQAKNSEFLNWRYGNCPGREYHIVRAENDGVLRGAAVLNLKDSSAEDAWLVDMVCDPGDSETISVLVDHSVRVSAGHGKGCLRTFCTSDRIRSHLFAFGFVKSRSTPRFTCKVERKPGTEFESVEWNVWHGDGDRELY